MAHDEADLTGVDCDGIDETWVGDNCLCSDWNLADDDEESVRSLYECPLTNRYVQDRSRLFCHFRASDSSRVAKTNLSSSFQWFVSIKQSNRIKDW